jgi:octopine/nopaline transport system substrate-binding protein
LWTGAAPYRSFRALLVPMEVGVAMTRLLARALGAVAALVLLAVPAGAKDWKKVVIATEGAYAPYNMHAPDGKLIGFEIDLGNDLCARAKITCEFIATDWDSVIPGLNAGKYDAIMDGMSITAKRLDVINFSRPYTQSPTTFAVPKSSPLAHMVDTGKRVSLDDKAATDAVMADLRTALKGKVIGVQVATIQADMLNTYLKGAVEIRTYKTTEEHDLDLTAGRIDAALASTSYFISTLGKPGGDQLTLAGPLITGGLLGKGTGIGLRKSDPELKVIFDKALTAALADGTVKQLSIKWFKTDISPAD